MPRTWKCQRQTKGVKCAAINPARNQKCTACGKKRPKRKEAKHKVILRTEYDVWVEQFQEICGICGRKPSARRRLDRDHDHKTGAWRGLLCARCNRALPSWITVEWLEAAAAYLRRTPIKKDDPDA